MTQPTLARFLTPAPHTIGHDQTIAAAHRVMREHGIRHLPVLESGRLVGIVSVRDLHLLETLKDVDPEHVAVSEAMSQEIYTVSPHASLREVAAQMAEHKYGAAIVVDEGKVAGVFTTVDALRALSALLEDQPPHRGQP
jgi:acetoin utilization protein AcuB